MDLTHSPVAPGAPGITVAVSRWKSFCEFLSRYRVPISVMVFTALVLEDVLTGIKPHDLFNIHDPKTVIGLALLFVGLGLRSWAAGILHKKAQLTTSGPYGVIRHPLYVGSFLMMFGFCTIIDDVENIWFVIGPFAALYLLHVLEEERGMAERHADRWRQYASAVPRFLPRRLPINVLAAWDVRQWLKNREYQAVGAVMLGLAAIQVWRQI